MFNVHDKAVVRRVVVLYLRALFEWPPAAVAIPVLITDRLSEVPSNFWIRLQIPWQHHYYCGHRALYISRCRHWGWLSPHHDRTAAVTEPYPAAVNTWLVIGTTAQPQSPTLNPMPAQTIRPSEVMDETVTAEVSAKWVCYYIEVYT